MANSIGKNNPNAGRSKVPKPNPENSVSPEPKNATKQMMTYSIVLRNYTNLCKYTSSRIHLYIKVLVHLHSQKNGELSEWPNEQAWKVCILARVSRVRISHSPLIKQMSLALSRLICLNSLFLY